MPVLLGNSSSPRWYAGSRARFITYLDHLKACGATSTEIPLHHGPFDIRTARVHAIHRNWDGLVAGFHGAGIAVQFHVSLDARFATQRWLDDAPGLQREYQPLLELVASVASEQPSTALVLHGAADATRDRSENDAATVALLRWLGDEFDRLPTNTVVALELGTFDPARPTASARSRREVLRLVEAVSSPRVGICWDLAHDVENAAGEAGWSVIPDERFLRRVAHVHLHDIDQAGVTHYPLMLGNVPFAEQLSALARLGPLPALTMEVRWRCARRLGVPWEVLRQSYANVYAVLDAVDADDACR